MNDQDFHYVIVTEFERHGWEVIDVYLGNPMKHDEKYLLINQAFAGKQRLMPFFNRQNNDDLILAIQTAQVYRGRLGFRKNKNDEKNPETEDYWNTAPTERMLLTPSISGVRSSRSTIFLVSMEVAFCNQNTLKNKKSFLFYIIRCKKRQ